jgi:hypothetical protein
MKILRQLQPWQTTLLQHPLPVRIVLFRQLATIPGAKGEAEIVAVEVEAEGAGMREGGERALALRTLGNVTRSAIWAEANICT